MIELTAEALSVLTRSWQMHLRVESWLGDELLHDDVPVAAASEEVDRSLRVPERVTLTVPRVDRGVSWSPTDPLHPLAAEGQQLRVQLGIGLGGDRVEWMQRGWYLVDEAHPVGDHVSVTAVGLLHLIDEARLVGPYQPAGTLAVTLQGLVEPALTVDVDAALVDRAVPTDINYADDRLGAVLELLDAWPADARVAPDGVLTVVPASEPTGPAVIALTDGVGGTVIEATGESTREGAWTAVVARGTASDGAQVQAVAYQGTGPRAAAGDFNPLAVPYFFHSPLLTTVGQCTAAARTVLARLQRGGRPYAVEMVPHPGIETGDVVDLVTAEYTGLAVVETLARPWTAGGGSQRMRVRAV